MRYTERGLTACVDCVGELFGCRPVNKRGKFSKENFYLMESCKTRRAYEALREIENIIESGNLSDTICLTNQILENYTRRIKEKNKDLGEKI